MCYSFLNNNINKARAVSNPNLGIENTTFLSSTQATGLNSAGNVQTSWLND